jgi:hypothetical protein
MDPRRLLEELADAARKLGIGVRTESLRVPIRSAGGLCRINGRQLIVLDERTSHIDRAVALAEVLHELELPLDTIQLTPEARALIEQPRTGLALGLSHTRRAPRPGIVSAKPAKQRARSRRSVK